MTTRSESAPPSLSEPEAARTPAPPRSRRSVALLVLVLGGLTAVGPLATDIYLPAFPQIARDLDVAEAQVQLTLTATMVGLALGQLAVGPMSDTWGRRRPLLVGAAVFTVASLLCVFVDSVAAFIAVRFLQGMAGAAGAVVSQAVVRDLFDGDDAARFFSRLMLVMGMAPLLGPVLGGQLLLVGPWQLNFVLLAVVSAVTFVTVLLWLPESLPVRDRRPLRPGTLVVTVGRLLRDVRFFGPALTLGLNFAVMFTYISSFSFVAQQELGVSPQTFSLVFAVNTVGLISGTQVNAFLIGRLGTPRRLVAGLLMSLASVAAIGVLQLAGAATLLPLTAALFVMMFSMGLVFPNATTLAITSQQASVAGTASALAGSLRFALGGALSVLAGIVAGGQASLASMTLVMVATSVTALAVFTVVGLLGRRSAH